MLSRTGDAVELLLGVLLLLAGTGMWSWAGAAVALIGFALTLRAVHRMRLRVRESTLP